MNCQHFESMIGDLSRGALLEAATREGARRHANDCRSCAARLANERALSAALRAVASNAPAVTAPSRVETALLAAFREQNARARVDAPVAGNGLSVARRLEAGDNILTPTILMPTAFKSWSWSKTFGMATAAAAVAASILLLVLLPAASRLRQAWNQESAQSHTESIAPQSTSPLNTTGAPNVATVTNPPDNPVSITSVNGDGSTNMSDGRLAKITRTTRGTNRSVMMPAVYRDHSEIKSSSQNSHPANSEGETTDEIVTEFMPLEHGGARLMAGDGGQLMRVELPRSALASFGLPVNHDRADERVKADVLMGDDGIARAIRFVR